MAGLEFEIPDNFLSGLLGTSFEDIAEEALDETAPILKEEMQRSLRTVMSSHGDSDLLNSLSASKPKLAKTDAYIITVNPKGKSNTQYYAGERHNRVYPVTNALKAIWLEYGNEHQAARPWLTAACNNANDKIMKQIQSIWEKKTGS